MILYHRTDCPFCWKVRLALAELEVEYETVDLELGDKPPELLDSSPTGTVPVLIDAGLAIWESSVIVDYLDAGYGPRQLIPANALVEARARLLHAYSDKIVGGCLKDIVFERRSKPEQHWDTDRIAAAEAKLHGCQSWLEARLGDEGFLVGDYSTADCALAARFGVAEAYGTEIPERFPKLRRWFEAVKSRDSWGAAYPTSFIRTEI